MIRSILTFVAAQTPGAWTPLAPATVASVMGLVGVWASVWGNELAIRFGRRRFILGTKLASGALAAVITANSGSSVSRWNQDPSQPG